MNTNENKTPRERASENLLDVTARLQAFQTLVSNLDFSTVPNRDRVMVSVSRAACALGNEFEAACNTFADLSGT